MDKDIIWVIVTGIFLGWLNTQTKKELKLYTSIKVKNIVAKYKILSEFIGSVFIILLFLCIVVSLLQCGGNSIIAIFLSSSYILTLMTLSYVIMHVICKINKNYNYNDILLVIAIRGHMSFQRMRKLLFSIFFISCSGMIYSTTRILMHF